MRFWKKDTGDNGINSLTEHGAHQGEGYVPRDCAAQRGEQLVPLLVQYEIDVVRRTHDLIELGEVTLNDEENDG